jgi:predicted acylesterase/phospholipase RssA
LNIGLANVLTGQYHSFKEHHTSDELISVLQASVAFPGVFKTVEAFDSVWFTGSAIYETDVIAPINHCREIGYKDKDIVLDIVLSGNPHIHHVYAKIFNAFAVAQRTFEITSHYERMFGLLRAKNGHPDIKFRHIIGPLREMPSKIVPVDYSPEEVKKQIEVG